MFSKELSYAHQSCIYLFKNIAKTVKIRNIFLQFQITFFLCEYMLKCNLFMWSIQHHYSILRCHMIFRNHSCAAQYFCGNWYILFFRILRLIESSKEQYLFEIQMFWKMIWKMLYHDIVIFFILKRFLLY